MSYRPIFDHNPETGSTICIIQGSSTKKVYYGLSQCHPEDLDMLSERTGCEIAYKRAYIKLLQDKRDTIKVRLSALNELYYSMTFSKNFNDDSYENKMLRAALRRTKNDLDTTRKTIIEERDLLREYIAKKEEFYIKVREMREKAKSE